MHKGSANAKKTYLPTLCKVLRPLDLASFGILEIPHELWPVAKAAVSSSPWIMDREQYVEDVLHDVDGS